jgi:hypothetical protein
MGAPHRPCAPRRRWAPGGSGSILVAAWFFGLCLVPPNDAAAQSVVALRVSPGKTNIDVGETKQLNAIGTLFSGDTVDLTNQVVWQSSDPSVVQVSNALFSRGRTTALRRGEAVISARAVNGVSSSDSGRDAHITVPAALLSVRVVPRQVQLPIGFTRTLEVEGLRADGSTSDLTRRAIWFLNDPLVATISNDPERLGELTAVRTGVTLIAAVDSVTGISSSVSDGDAVLTVGGQVISLAVRPGEAQLAVGGSREFTVRATLSDGSAFDLPRRDIEWTSTNPAVASVSNDGGDAGLVTAHAQGLTFISGTHIRTGIAASESAVVLVLGTLRSIRVTPVDRSIDLGQSKSMTAIGTFVGGPTGTSEVDISDQVVWSSNNPSVVSISNEPGSRGRATAHRSGTAIISATSATGISSSTSGGDARVRGVAEVVSIRIVPVHVRIPAGFTVSLEAEATRADGSVDEVSSKVTWSTSDLAVAEVSNEPGRQGDVLAVRSGVAVVSALDPDTGISSATSGGNGTVTVGGRVVKLSIRPAEESMAVGSGRRFAVRATMDDDTFFTIPRRDVVWVSSNPAVATVDNSLNAAGLVTAIARGEAILSATHPVTSLTTTENAVIQVLGTLTALRITPEDRSIDFGESKSMTAIGTFAGGPSGTATAEVTDQVLWESSDPDIVSVSNESGSRGSATGLRSGVAFISATAENGVSSSDSGGDARVRVTAELASITIVPGAFVLPVGFTRSIEAEGTRIDGTRDDVSSNVTWSISDPSVATVSNASGSEGDVTALRDGAASISVLDPQSGVSSSASGGDAVVTVGGRVVSVAVQPAEQVLPVDLTRQFSLRAVLEDTSFFSLPRASVVWTSSTPSVASVNATGLVTALARGEARLSAVHTPTGLSSADSDQDAIVVVPGRMEALEVRPQRDDLFVGGIKRFSAYALLEDGSDLKLSRDIEFTSSEPDIALVSNVSGERGDTLGVDQGTAGISVVHVPSGLSSVSTGGDAVANVLGMLEALRVQRAGKLRTGDQRRLEAIGVVSTEGAVTGELRSVEFEVGNIVEWTSSNPAVIRIEGDRALAVGLGEAVISARDPTSGVISGSSGGDAVFEVIAELKQIKIAPRKMRTRIGASKPKAFTVIGLYSDKAKIEITENIEFTSQDPTVAQVRSSGNRRGEVIPVRQGKTRVTAVEPITGISAARAPRIVVKKAKRR